MSDRVLSVRDLQVRFGTKRGVASVVNGISYDLERGETLAIVGESGSGKSVSVLALMRLLPEPPASISGSVQFGGQDLLALPEKELRSVRGNHLAMIFQDPMTSLNPVRRVGDQLMESMALHLDLIGDTARDRAIELLDLVGIPSPSERVDAYPHQMSGGMRQRVMIAMGLSCDPAVLIADEATTALDVTTQAQITDLVADLQEKIGMAVIWITHDLGVVASIADRVLVMYGGRFMEEAKVDDLYEAPRHPYTEGLLGSLPMPGAERPDQLVSIPGLPPDPVTMPLGCPFQPRCTYADQDRCAIEVPVLEPVDGAHRTACFHPLGATV
jgi:oligopeptide/dipeptide ABC transporter ATP-binding protein